MNNSCGYPKTADSVENDDLDFRVTKTAIISMLVCILIFITVLGNSLIVAAVCKFKKLRTPQYIFLCSLATSDLLLGVLTLPLNLVRQIYGYWPLGPTMCKIHLFVDILLCTASIWNLCMISISRWWLLNGKSYRCISNRCCICMVLGVWFWSGMVCSWSVIAHKTGDPMVCHHSQKKWYAVFSSCSSFYIPLVIMCCAYGRITCILKSQVKSTQLRRMMLRRQKKLHLTTGLIMGVFIICWFPFFQAHVTQLLCPSCCIPTTLLQFFEWFAYCNSALTPLIYTSKKSELRKAFNVLLRNKTACEAAFPSLYDYSFNYKLNTLATTNFGQRVNFENQSRTVPTSDPEQSERYKTCGSPNL